MSNLQPMLGTIRDALVETRLADEAARAARPHALETRRHETRSYGPLLALAFAGACTMAGFFFGRSRALPVSAPPPSAALVSSVPVGQDVTARDSLNFSDGTRVDVVADGAARVLAVDAHGGRLRVEHGTAHFAFVHRDAQTHWKVEAGPMTVEVTGTRFDVTWEPSSEDFALRMIEGSVVVKGCGVDRRASGTDVVVASCRPTSPPPVVATPVAELPTLAPAPASPPRALPVVVAPPPVGPGLASLTAEADAARLAGDGPRATRALLTIREAFPDAGAQAAFDLGVVAFDIDHRPAEATTWFRRYLAEAPRGPIAREALGRSMESLSATGDADGAAAAARTYLATYPDGAHARLAKRLVRP